MVGGKHMNCSNCRKEVQENWVVCPECGTKVQSTEVDSAQINENNVKPIYKKWWFWVLLILF